MLEILSLGIAFWSLFVPQETTWFVSRKTLCLLVYWLRQILEQVFLYALLAGEEVCKNLQAIEDWLNSF